MVEINSWSDLLKHVVKNYTMFIFGRKDVAGKMVMVYSFNGHQPVIVMSCTHISLTEIMTTISMLLIIVTIKPTC
ncbi:hypothetical protein HMPREF0484_1193 [Klebsiella pneumoniae subsp. rhinoscleromatis ATCC 13884]|nr:hypothetical protein HMPREF0484_1193 [Klebsiella pneumoniae subsp. rhinoscleromatis ATCC 13884]